jgi:hypothetical protein
MGDGATQSQKAEGRRQKAEGRRQKAEGRRQKEPPDGGWRMVLFKVSGLKFQVQRLGPTAERLELET